MSRGVVALAAIVAALAIYLAYDMHSEKGDKAKAETASALFPFKPDQVNEFTLEKGSSKIHVVRSVDGWKMDEPIKDWADNAFADDFVDRVAKDKSLEFANEGPNIDWKVYGLDQPAGKITLRAQSGESRTVDVSEKHNFEGNALGHIEGEDRVRVLPPSWNLTIDRKPLEFRDKRLFRGKIGGVEKIAIKNKFGELSLEQKDGQWIMPSHSDWVLDQNRVRELLSQVNETKAQDFLLEHAPSPAEKAKFGLGKPELSVRFTLKDHEWSASVARDKGRLIAEVSDPPTVLAVDVGALDRLFAAKSETVRDLRGPFRFKADAVHEIDLKTSLKKSTYRLEQGSWRLVDGSTSAQVDQAKMRELVSKLGEMAAVGIATPAQAAAFQGASSLELKDDKRASLFNLSWDSAFTEKNGETTRDLHVAKVEGQRDAYLVEDATIQQLSLQNLTSQPAAPAAETR